MYLQTRTWKLSCVRCKNAPGIRASRQRQTIETHPPQARCLAANAGQVPKQPDFAFCIGIWRVPHFLRGSGFRLSFLPAGEGAEGGSVPGFAGWAARSSR